ncbi:MAG TPA: DNA-binding protein [Blastocatellia bacterium]|nr:DNA-binding protein [Blastocatellia bacterium]
MAELLTVPQAKERYGFEADRWYLWARENFFGDLPVIVRFGRQIRVNAEAFEQFVAKGGKSLPGGWRREPQTSVALATA